MRQLALCLALTPIAACGGARDRDSRTIAREVDLQIAAAKDATIPASVTLTSSSGPTRQGQSVSAEWSFDAPDDWSPYLVQADASLRRAGYEPGSASADERVFTKHVPGDAYRVRIVRDSPGPRRVTITFSAGPD